MSKFFITTDIDGKILSFDNFSDIEINTTNIFNKRIYNFFHVNSVLDFIKNFEKKEKNFEGSFLFKIENKVFVSTVVVKKKNDDLLHITIILKNDNIEFNVKNRFFDKLNIILRTKFVLGSFIPLIFSILWSFNDYKNFSFYMLIPLIIGVLFFHISANLFNDYFDWKSGRDSNNLDYVLFSTGGSRAIDFGFISEKKMFFLSIVSFCIVFFSGVYIIYFRGLFVLYIGFFAAFCVYFYSAPPIHLASRYGAGEFVHILCLGPLFVIGSKFTLLGYFEYIDFFVGIPFGLLITSCLLMNEYPDSNYDKKFKKNNLAVYLGSKYVPYLFLLMVFLSYFFIIFCVYYKSLCYYFLLILFTIPYAVSTTICVFNISKGRFFVSYSCVKSFKLYLYFSTTMIFASFFRIIF